MNPFIKITKQLKKMGFEIDRLICDNPTFAGFNVNNPSQACRILYKGQYFAFLEFDGNNHFGFSWWIPSEYLWQAEDWDITKKDFDTDSIIHCIYLLSLATAKESSASK